MWDSAPRRVLSHLGARATRRICPPKSLRKQAARDAAQTPVPRKAQSGVRRPAMGRSQPSVPWGLHSPVLPAQLRSRSTEEHVRNHRRCDSTASLLRTQGSAEDWRSGIRLKRRGESTRPVRPRHDRQAVSSAIHEIRSTVATLRASIAVQCLSTRGVVIGSTDTTRTTSPTRCRRHNRHSRKSQASVWGCMTETARHGIHQPLSAIGSHANSRRLDKLRGVRTRRNCWR